MLQSSFLPSYKISWVCWGWDALICLWIHVYMCVRVHTYGGHKSTFGVFLNCSIPYCLFIHSFIYERESIWRCVYGSQRTVCWSVLAPAALWILGIKFELSDLMVDAFCPLQHLASPYLIFWDSVSHYTWSSLIKLDWLPTFVGLRLQDYAAGPGFLHGFWTQILTLAMQVLHSPNRLPRTSSKIFSFNKKRPGTH